jgi:hypothetical protein
MIRLIGFLSLLSFPVLTVAQHAPLINPSRGMAAPSNAYRHGNILFPGGIPAPHMNTHAARLGGTISGTIPYTGVPPGQAGRHGRPRTVVVPYAYPVFYGGGYGGYYQEPPATNVTVVMPQQPAPSVIINNTYIPETAKPSLKEYSTGELPETGIRVFEGAGNPARREAPPSNGRSIMDEKPTIHLIALTDGTVRQALGYWVQGDNLHYVTPESTVNHVSLAMLDRERSIELNAERKLEFDVRLPR